MPDTVKVTVRGESPAPHPTQVSKGGRASDTTPTRTQRDTAKHVRPNDSDTKVIHKGDKSRREMLSHLEGKVF